MCTLSIGDHYILNLRIYFTTSSCSCEFLCKKIRFYTQNMQGSHVMWRTTNNTCAPTRKHWYITEWTHAPHFNCQFFVFIKLGVSSSVCPICGYVIANQLPLTHAEKSVNQTVFVCPSVIKIKSIVAVLPEVKRGINDSNKNDAVWHC